MITARFRLIVSIAYRRLWTCARWPMRRRALRRFSIWGRMLG